MNRLLQKTSKKWENKEVKQKRRRHKPTRRTSPAQWVRPKRTLSDRKALDTPVAEKDLGASRGRAGMELMISGILFNLWVLRIEFSSGEIGLGLFKVKSSGYGDG